MNATTGFQLPNTLVLIFCIITCVGVLTWIIDAGEFERTLMGGRMVVVPNSYRAVEPQPQGIGAILSAPLRGFVDAAAIIGFVFVAGGAFGVVNATGAITAAIHTATRAVERHPLLQAGTIPLLMGMFSLAGATFGMSEEILAFIFIFVPFARALGYDAIVGVAIPLIGSGAGFAAALLNPFTIGIAQGIAELPMFSGLEFRFVAWILVTVVAVAFVQRYAKRIQQQPSLSAVHELELSHEPPPAAEKVALTKRHRGVMVVFSCALLALIIGALAFDWYINELSALFLTMGIACGIAGGMRINAIADAFVTGAKDMMMAALVIGFSRGILVVATDGKIIDTMLASFSSVVDGAHPVFSAYLMLAVQTCINFFVPSGSGQAALTMPIMAPLSDLLGITRQTAVLIFQFGDGLTNMIIPTSGVTMGCLGIAKIPWERWARWILPLEGFLYLTAVLLITVAVITHWGPH